MASSAQRYLHLVHLTGKRRPSSSKPWSPPADIYRTHDGWVVKVELAGIQLEDLKIEFEGPTLTIKGCRRDTFYGEGVWYQQLEITYSSFEKVLRFPCTIDDAHLVRDYRDGLLILHLRSESNCE